MIGGKGAAKDEVLDLVTLTFELNRPADRALRESGISKPPKGVKITRDSTAAYRVEGTDSDDALVPNRGPAKYDLALEALKSQLKTFDSVPLAVELAEGLGAAKQGSGIAEGIVPRVREELIPALAEGDQASVTELANQMDAAFNDPSATADPPDVIEILRPFLPRLIYFDDTVDFVKDSISYAEVKADPSQHRTMINLATVANVDLLNEAEKDGHVRQRDSRLRGNTL